MLIKQSNLSSIYSSMREFEPNRIQKILKHLFKRGFTDKSSLKDIEQYISDYYPENNSKEIAFLYVINYDSSGNFNNARTKNENSTYFFIADYASIPTNKKDSDGEILYKKKLNIEKLNKLNIYDLADLITIQMMKTRISFNSGKSLYMIKTDEGLLDDYSGMSGHEIPDFILKSIDEGKEKI